jgi:dienelactone hydrolase
MSASPESFASSGKSVRLDVYMPATTGLVPVVLVLHGSFGMLPQYRADIESFAEALAANGIGAALLHYLDATGDGPALPLDHLDATIKTRHLLWRQVCLDALSAVAADSRFDSSRIGVLGFSLGGFLALSVAMDPPASVPIAGVVDFFGPTDLLDTHWLRLPRALIFHGGADPLVDRVHSDRVASGLTVAGRKEGTDFTYEVYAKQGHGFKAPDLDDSRDKTVEFFKSVLKVSP